jgi:hypothetical protein
MIQLLSSEMTVLFCVMIMHVRGFLLGKETNEATVTHLRQDLAAHRAHMQTLANRLDRVAFEVESKCEVHNLSRILELGSWILLYQRNSKLC